MGIRTYAQTISDTEVMVKGIRDNQEVLSKRQIDMAFADALQQNIDDSIALNNEQETLKAKLKAKTEQLDAVITALEKKASEARKIIKLDIPQSSWREFGINDKR
jgi:phospholipid N-methyltransferase